VTLRVAFVNNMPSPAFEATDKQFARLLGKEAVLSRYWLAGTPRTAEVQAVAEARYRPLGHLYRCPPDLLVVTGAEPKAAELAGEAYWPELEDLLWWARSCVPVAVLSCLAAHAALWSFDSLARRRLGQKCSGVFSQRLERSDPLVAGLGQVAFPHSRWNDVPVGGLVEMGYRVAAGWDGGWTIASAERGQCLFVLFQGHPEYEPLTLLREHRRDARRYLNGEGPYPAVPVGYLDDEGEEILAQFAARATSGPPDPALMALFPFQAAARHVRARWRGASRGLAVNLLGLVHQRAAGPLYSGRSA